MKKDLKDFVKEKKNNVLKPLLIYTCIVNKKKIVFHFDKKELCYFVGDIDDVSDNDRHIYKKEKKIGEEEEE